MKLNSAFVRLLSLFAFGVPASAWSAGTESKYAQKQAEDLTSTDVKKAVAEATGYGPESLDVTRKPHLVTVTVIDSKLNGAPRGDREAEAQKIAVAVENVISAQPEYSQIWAIHVDYVKTEHGKKHSIQGIDFNKSAAGTFSIHKS